MKLKISYETKKIINHEESQVNSDIPESMSEFSKVLSNITSKYFGVFQYTIINRAPKTKNKKRENYSYYQNENAFLEITETIKTEVSTGLGSIVNNLLHGEFNDEIKVYSFSMKFKLIHPESFCDTTKNNYKAELNALINRQQQKYQDNKIKTNFNPHIGLISVD